MIATHQSIYPRVPPQGIYFEALVEGSFKRIEKPVTVIEAGGRNQPRHDLLVDQHRISLKTETGLGTKPHLITITKLCTTERRPWEAQVLVRRVMEHLSRYDVILMLRSLWAEDQVRYQLVDIPVTTLRKIEHAVFEAAGRGGSLGADVIESGERLFHVHFDASDRKCSIRGLGIKYCTVLVEWDVRL
ncbi:MAG: hypothetical protein ACRD2B_13635 [Terriglobia bacterium]